MPLLNGIVQSAAMFAAVLILGEAMRNRRALDRANRLLQAEQDRSERLLRNALPGPIADWLKRGEEVIADGFPEVTVLFVDLVDFTRRSHRSSRNGVVRVLDDLFSALTGWPSATAWRRSRPSATPTWWSGACPSPDPTTSSDADRSRSRARGHWTPGSWSPGAVSPAEARGVNPPRTRPRRGR
jgi:hypothetical protein